MRLTFGPGSSAVAHSLPLAVRDFELLQPPELCHEVGCYHLHLHLRTLRQGNPRVGLRVVPAFSHQFCSEITLKGDATARSILKGRSIRYSASLAIVQPTCHGFKSPFSRCSPLLTTCLTCPSNHCYHCYRFRGFRIRVSERWHELDFATASVPPYLVSIFLDLGSVVGQLPPTINWSYQYLHVWFPYYHYPL